MELLSNRGNAIYLNFPFCKNPCSYCHYKKNLYFGYNEIPNDYFSIFLIQLEDICKKIENTKLNSIYFGGGSPSLLTDKQIDKIRKIFDKYFIFSDEVSIEIHPLMCNLDYFKNNFFTRYSFGIQSFNNSILKKYNRKEYNFDDLKSWINKLQIDKKIVNIDLIFNENIDQDEYNFLNIILPDSITFYPNTFGRGIDRLINVNKTLDNISKNLDDYIPLNKSKFIYLKFKNLQSKYSIIEYEKMGNIIGIGHNSISYINDKSYLSSYKNEKYEFIERKYKGNRYINTIFSGITTGILWKNISKYKELSNSLLTVDKDLSVFDKHSKIEDDSLVYLPVSNYWSFYEKIKDSFEDIYLKSYLSAIAYGDTDLNTINKYYNYYLDSNTLKNEIGNDNLHKIEAPNLLILIEGIDGSGKDTFAYIFVNELKKRFYYSNTSKISVMGQPDSHLNFGQDCKNFVENGIYLEESKIINSLIINRQESEKKIKNLSGIIILIRGLVTDKAIVNKIFNREDEYLGENKIIKKWDKFILIDVDEKTADKRIESRAEERDWRENKELLHYFRNYYLNYNSSIFSEKIIFKNDDINKLREFAIKLADEIYIEQYKKYDKK